MVDAKENPARLLLPNGYELDNDVDEENEEETGAEKTASPEYISSKILKKLFDTVEETTGERITRAIIGVSAYFNDVQREATIKVKQT